MSFNVQDLLGCLPALILLGSSIIILMVDVFSRAEGKSFVAWLSLMALGAALLADFILLSGQTTASSLFGACGEGVVDSGQCGVLAADGYARYFDAVFIAGAFLTVLLSPHYLKEHEIKGGEYYPLLLIATAGMMIMAASTDLITLFLGLETMSIAVYVLAAIWRENQRSLESAIKYLVTGAFSTAILLYGMAHIYGATGSTNLAQIASSIGEGGLAPGVLMGVLFMLAGFGFKIATVPFHMWTPDVYEGAPTSITCFMAVAVKAAGFAALVRVFVVAFGGESLRLGPQGWFLALYFLSIVTMSLGNLAALAQRSVKRMLAYSSIAHAGYMLMGLVVWSSAQSQGETAVGSISSILFYLLAYTFTNTGAFGIMILLGRKGSEGLELDDYRGLAVRHPVMALAMALFMFSLAGFPPTAGFFAKYYVFRSAVNAGMYWLAIIGVLNSLISVYYYLRVVVMMYMREGDRQVVPLINPPAVASLVLSASFVLFLGIFPSGMVAWAVRSVQMLLGG